MENRNYYASNKRMETKIAYQTANNGYQIIGRYDKNRAHNIFCVKRKIS